MPAQNTEPLLTVTPRRERRWAVLAVAGEIDLSTAPTLRDSFDAAIGDHEQPPNIIADLSDVEFCDASGLSEIVRAYRRIKQRSGQLRLVCPARQVLRVMRITELTRLLPIYPTLKEATSGHAEVM